MGYYYGHALNLLHLHLLPYFSVVNGGLCKNHEISWSAILYGLVRCEAQKISTDFNSFYLCVGMCCVRACIMQIAPPKATSGICIALKEIFKALILSEELRKYGGVLWSRRLILSHPESPSEDTLWIDCESMCLCSNGIYFCTFCALLNKFSIHHVTLRGVGSHCDKRKKVGKNNPQFWRSFPACQIKSSVLKYMHLFQYWQEKGGCTKNRKNIHSCTFNSHENWFEIVISLREGYMNTDNSPTRVSSPNLFVLKK